ncbi:MAG: DUF2235 domain-containing protein [Dehalococcoidia bacterium]
MSKRIVVCSDGTWQGADSEHQTNVLKLYLATKDAAPNEQVVFYDEGVGVRGSRWDRWSGGAFGNGLTKNIEDGYRFLIRRYEPGDEIFLFGFSRGAYTVRSLAGLLHCSGLLRRDYDGQLGRAMELYRSKQVKPKDEQARRFRETFGYGAGPSIKFIGVWDTVGALGVPGTALSWFRRRRHRFHDVELSSSIENAAHALAIDERRRSFKPAVMKRSSDFTGELHQSWFAGVHSDVGGGYARDGLSDVTLEWVVGHARDRGLAVDEGPLTLDADGNGKLHDSRKGFPWKWLPGRSREVSQPPPLVHETVDRRIADANLDYDPKNLRKARSR